MSDWGQLVGEATAAIMSAAFRITGRLADAEDIAQEVYCEAFHKWRNAHHKVTVGLLRTIAVRRALDLVRRRKRDPQIHEQLDRISLDSPPDDGALERELEAYVRELVADLPNREAEVFCLSCFETQSVSEIAATLKLSNNAVSKSLSLARSKIQAGLTLYLQRGEK
ncbi:RNA polymerase sigma factor [Pirellulaceae bacterium SH501]